jgi:CO/xanthine dehydrogenase FAD-binding subunit
MKKPFTYLRPLTPIEACHFKEKHDKKAKFWAGGTDLLLQWRDEKINLDYCVDLTFIHDLEFIRKDSDQICIGSLTTVNALEDSSKLDNSLSIIREAAGKLGPPGIRTTATIGGNICNAAPSADLATPLIVLGAQAKFLSSAGERWVNMDEFFLNVNQTALKENELLVEIRIPIPQDTTAASFLKIDRNVVDIAIVNMSMKATMDDSGIFSDVKIAFGAVAPTPIRIKSAEQLLLGADIFKIEDTLIDEVGNRVAKEVKPITDVRSSAEYRRAVSKVLSMRALNNVISDLKKRRKA